MTKNVKIWTTVSQKVLDEIKEIKRLLGYNTETEVIRDAIRNGLLLLKLRANLILQSKVKKRKGAIFSPTVGKNDTTGTGKNFTCSITHNK